MGRGKRWRRHCLRRRLLASRNTMLAGRGVGGVSACSKSTAAARAEKYFNSLLAVLRSFGRRTSRATTATASQVEAAKRRGRAGNSGTPRGHRARGQQQSWFNRLPAAASCPRPGPPPPPSLHLKVNDRFCVQCECRKKNTSSKAVSAATTATAHAVIQGFPPYSPRV